MKKASGNAIGVNYKMESFWHKNKVPYLFLLPTVLYLIIFQLYPLLESLRLSFTNLSLLIPGSGKFVWLDNYKKLLVQDKDFWNILFNTFFWVIASTVLQYLLSIPAALVLNQKLKLRPLWRGLTMVPWVTPTVIMGLIWKWMYDGDYGLINYYLNTHISWLGSEWTVWPSLLLSSTWKGLPYAIIMVLAGLQGIPGSLYEAAYIDGSSDFQAFRKITMPMLKPVLMVSVMISIVMTWTKFEMIWVLTAGGPGVKTSILPTYIYTKAFQYFDFGEGSAVAVLAMIMMLIFIMIYVKAVKKIGGDDI